MRPGELVAGRFEIEAIAGTGGMGTVYRARDRAAGEPVALKTLSGVGEGDAARFAREAAVLAELVHPGIVRYIAHGVSPHHEHYLVMEWLDGDTLHGRLTHGRLSVADTVVLGRAIAEALAVAHRRGVVHRDIKPMNLFLPGDDVARVKLLDFGIARHVAHAGILTHTGVIVGTPGYMAPEQVRGDTGLDARTDVFALGCVLYRCLTGTSAFGGDQSLAVLAKILVEDVLPPSSIAPDVPPGLDALVLRMLAKAPDARPADGAAVAHQLAALGDITLRDVPRAPTLRGPGGADTVSSTAPSTNRVLTIAEQRLVSIVLTGPLADEAAQLEQLRTTATAFGGRLERISDGASLVLFAHAGVATDHAMRAARCALALREVVPGAALVVASGRAAVDRLPVGDVIDRAVRALDGLGPGQLALDDATAGLLYDRFVVVERGARRLLRGMKDSGEPARTLLGRQTPIVGRDRELATLEGLWAQCVDERVARAVLVSAPPGAGKSRLRQELVRRVLQRDEHAELLIGRGDALRAGSPFALIADAIRRTAGVREGDGLDEQRAGLLARCRRFLPGPDGERVAHLLGELAGVAFPSEASEALRAARADPIVRGDAMREAWTDWLVAECNHHPVLLVLEDLHWGDRPTVDYADAALRELAGAPLMVVALARPEVHDLFPKLWNDRELQEIRLPALTRKAGERLVRDLLGDAVEQATVQRIVDRSAGNAFFLEELIRAVAEGHSELPDSVLSMLQQRLDQLGAEPKRVLRAAAVFGEVFWRGGVAALLGGDHKLHLQTLVERELIAVSPESRLPGETEYAFRHDLVREAAYATTSASDRVLGHRLAGEWLVAHGFSDALALAGHFSLGDDRPRAAELFAIAAEQAIAGNDNSSAILHADRGLACGAVGELAGRLHLARAEGFNWRGEHGSATDAAAHAVTALRHGSADWFRAQDELFFAVGRLGEIPRAMLVMRDMTATEAAPDAALHQLRSIARAAIVMLRFGPPDVGIALLGRVDELAGRITVDTSTEQRLWSLRAMVARYRGQVDECIAANQAAVRACELTRNLRELAFTYLAYGGTYDEIGAPDQAVPILERGIELAERIGVGTVAMLLYFSLAMTQAHRGRHAEARVLAGKALASCGRYDRAVSGLCRFVLANVALALGELDEARREIDEALDRLATFPEYRAFALATLARIHIALGETADARDAATEARKILKPHNGFQEGESLVRLAEIEALEAAGDHAAAKLATELAIARLEVRASRIDEAWRAVFLAKPDNAATLRRRS